MVESHVMTRARRRLNEQQKGNKRVRFVDADQKLLSNNNGNNGRPRKGQASPNNDTGKGGRPRKGQYPPESADTGNGGRPRQGQAPPVDTVNGNGGRPRKGQAPP